MLPAASGLRPAEIRARTRTTRASPGDLRQVDGLCGELIAEAERDGARVIVVSEYGIVPVREAVHINRVLREAGLVRMRIEQGRELLDAGASKRLRASPTTSWPTSTSSTVPTSAAVKRLLEGVDGIAQVLDEAGKREAGLDHPRSGELVALAEARPLVQLLLVAGRRAGARLRADGRYPPQAGLRPDGAVLRPGDPVAQARDRVEAAKRKLGLRQLLDVTPVPDTSLVKGSHGLDHRRPGGRAAGDLERGRAAARGVGGRDRVQGAGAGARLRAFDRAGLAPCCEARRSRRSWHAVAAA